MKREQISQNKRTQILIGFLVLMAVVTILIFIFGATYKTFAGSFASRVPNLPWQVRYQWNSDNEQGLVLEAVGNIDVEKAPDKVILAAKKAFADVGVDIAKMSYSYYCYGDYHQGSFVEKEWMVIFSSDLETQDTLFCAFVDSKSLKTNYLYEAQGVAAQFAVNNGIQQSVFSSTIAHIPNPTKMYLDSETVRVFKELPSEEDGQLRNMEIRDYKVSTGEVVQVWHFFETNLTACLSDQNSEKVYERNNNQWTDVSTGKEVNIDPFSFVVED